MHSTWRTKMRSTTSTSIFLPIWWMVEFPSRIFKEGDAKMDWISHEKWNNFCIHLSQVPMSFRRNFTLFPQFYVLLMNLSLHHPLARKEKCTWNSASISLSAIVSSAQVFFMFSIFLLSFAKCKKQEYLARPPSFVFCSKEFPFCTLQWNCNF